MLAVPWRFEIPAGSSPFGEGATSRVFQGVDRERGGPVALKVGRSAGQRARLADEAARLAWVESPWLSRVVDAGLVPDGTPVEAGLPYLALEWRPGTPLSEVERRDEALALRVAWGLASALADVHAAGTAHGDVKPANVVVDDEAAALIDFGLAAPGETPTPTGGTPRYLAPEIHEGAGDGYARDLWALGLVIAEAASDAIAGSDDPRATVDRTPLPRTIEPIVRSLLAVAPGARPSAEWVRRRAAEALGEASSQSNGGALVRRAYLRVRRREIDRAARCRTNGWSMKGTARLWLEEATELGRRIARLRGSLAEGPVPELGELGEIGRAEWMVRLVGPVAASWPALSEETDSSIADRLAAAAESRHPSSFALADILGSRPVAAGPLEEPAPTDIALAIGSGAPDSPTLELAERLVLQGAAGPAMTLATLRALRLRGELGRALALVAEDDTADVQLEAAEACRRAGDRDGTLGWLARITAKPPRAREVATRARLALDVGDFASAREILTDSPHAVSTCEVRALVELAAGNLSAAREAVLRGRHLASTEEERARLGGVEGTIAHANGDAELARNRFRDAAERAGRAGALLEEATYLTGLSAAAADLGAIEESLEAAKRSMLLFAHLGRTRESARACLNRAAALATVGAHRESIEAAEGARRLAREAGDRRCEAYCHVTSAGVLRDEEGLEHAIRAVTLLEGAPNGDQLRARAMLLRRGGPTDVAAGDELARDPTAATAARLDWWGARAEALAKGRGDGRAEPVLEQLSALAAQPAPVGSRGPALVAGAQLAASRDDGDAARRLAAAGANAAHALLRGAPAVYRAAAAAEPWVIAAAAPEPARISPRQVAQIETLVRSLGTTDALRPVLDQILDALVLWTGVERGLLLLRAPGGRLVPRAGRNLSRKDLEGAQRELSHSLAERALEAGEPVVAVDAAGELPEVHASVHALKLRSVLAVPLQAQGESLGVVYLDDRVRRGAFGPRELSWVRLVASVAAVAIARARDRLLLRRAARQAKRSEAKATAALARAEAELRVAEQELALQRDGRDTRHAYEAIIGNSEPITKMLRMVDRVAASEVPVLLMGESGSGKELVARAIHDNGPRKGEPFVAENCSAIPEGLLESTLFGHVRGAFTGASRPRSGLFEVADGGTLFLDEIGEMSLGMQAKLLRVLEGGEVRPVGSESSRTVDVRVVGATHRDLSKLVEAGRFRSDLLYRLDVITIRIPPLRERREDVAVLVQHFLRKHADGAPPKVSDAALHLLSRYDWPGNVRQLENEVRRAVVLADGAIGPEHLGAPAEGGSGSGTDDDAHTLNVRRRVDRLETELLREALAQTDGNQTRAAEILGVSRFGLQKMMKRLQISLPAKRGGRRGSGRVARNR